MKGYIFKFDMGCDKCNQFRVIAIPSTTIQSAKKIFGKILPILDHPISTKNPIKNKRCSGKWRITSDKK